MGRFDGAWEEKGVIGPRVEIDGDRLVYLWQASVVLETRFDIVQDGGKTILKLEHNGLRNSGSLDPYAVINECYYDGSALVFVDDYRFSGESTVKMYPTKNSRYGNVTLVNDEILPLVQGKWESKYTDLTFKDDHLFISSHDDGTTECELSIVCARSNSSPDKVSILDKEPSRHSIGSFYSLTFTGGVLTGMIEVCDDKPIIVTFSKA